MLEYGSPSFFRVMKEQKERHQKRLKEIAIESKIYCDKKSQLEDKIVDRQDDIIMSFAKFFESFVSSVNSCIEQLLESDIKEDQSSGYDFSELELTDEDKELLSEFKEIGELVQQHCELMDFIETVDFISDHIEELERKMQTFIKIKQDVCDATGLTMEELENICREPLSKLNIKVSDDVKRLFDVSHLREKIPDKEVSVVYE